MTRPTAPGPTAVEVPAARLAEIAGALPSHIRVEPETVQQDLARLVLTLVETLRRVVEHQALQRMDDGDLSPEQVERMGTALQLLEEKMGEIRGAFGLAGEELNVDLGPLGRLL
jgi:hypothetical protein